MRTKFRRPRRIAPRLANGESRDGLGSRLAPEVKRGLQMRAVAENKSMSWIIEEMLVARLHLKRPEYVVPANQTEEEKSFARGTLRKVSG